MRHSRPVYVTYLSLGVLISSVFHWIRLGQVVRLWDYLHTLPLSAPPLYLAASAGVFGLFGLVTAVLLWAGFKWAPMLARGYGISLAVAVWLERLLFSASPKNEPWLFLAMFTILFLGLLLAILAYPPVVEYYAGSSSRHTIRKFIRRAANGSFPGSGGNDD